MNFVLIEVKFKGQNPFKLPVVEGNQLLAMCQLFDNSDKVTAFRVVDNVPVTPIYYRWGQFNKWVVEFGEHHFKD